MFRLVQVRCGDGKRYTYTYDGHGRVINVVHDKFDTSTEETDDGVDIATFTYNYDAA